MLETLHTIFTRYHITFHHLQCFLLINRWHIPNGYIYMKAIQMLKTIRGDAPEYLMSSFTFASDIHARLLRSSSNFQLYTPKPHLEIYQNTFVFSGSPVCNSLPSHIDNSNSVHHFKVG